MSQVSILHIAHKAVKNEDLTNQQTPQLAPAASAVAA